MRERGLLTTYTNQPRASRVTMGLTTPIRRKTGSRSRSAFQSGSRIGLRKSMNPWNSRPMASNIGGILARSRARRATVADAGRGCPHAGRVARPAGEPLREPRRALDARAAPASVATDLVVVRDDHNRPGPRRPERRQRLGHALADVLVRGDVPAVRDVEARRDATGGAA